MIRRVCIAMAIGVGLIAIVAGAWQLRNRPEPQLAMPEIQPSTPESHAFELAPANFDHELESPDVSVDAHGRIYLVWASREKEGQKTLFISISNDHGKSFSEPQVVSRTVIHEPQPHVAGESHHEIGMSPRLATGGEAVTVAWIQSVAENSTVCLVSMESTDGGQSFAAPVGINQSLNACPNFTSLAACDNQRAYCWLDLRDQQRQVFTALGGEMGGIAERRVFTAKPSERACKCCPTAVAFGPQKELFVAFREGDRILLARAKDHAAEFGSVITVADVSSPADKCGHDCPSLAIDDEKVYVSWTDASGGVPRVKCAVAKLSDLKFSAQAINPQGKNSEGRCRLLTLGGTLHAVWEESEPAQQFISAGSHDDSEPQPRTVIKYSSRAAAASKFAPALVVDDVPGANQTHPALAGDANGDIFVAWNQSSDHERIVVVKKLSSSSSGGAVQ